MHIITQVTYSFPIDAPGEYDSDTCTVVGEVDFVDGEACNPRIYAAQRYGNPLDPERWSDMAIWDELEEALLEAAQSIYLGTVADA